MKLIREKDLSARTGFFEILTQTAQSQLASMIIAPGKASGEYGTDHPDSDQILIVLSGRATVKVDDETLELGEGDVCLIEAGEPHQVRNEGVEELRTFNIYAPPAY